MQADFRIRDGVAPDASAEAILGDRDPIASAVLAKLRSAGLARGQETELAEAFSDILVAYRWPTPGKFIEFYQARGVPIEPERVDRYKTGWAKANLMADGRRVAPDSISVSTIHKASETTVTETTTSKFYRWINPDRATERGLPANPTSPAICGSIRVLKQENGPGSEYTLTIGFLQTADGKWLPVMNLIDGATERPVYSLPL